MSAPFTQIEIIRPGDLSSRAFDFLTGLEFPDQISAAANRTGNPDTSDWRLTWLVTTPIDVQSVIAHIAVQAEMVGVNDDVRVYASDVTLKDIAATNWLEESYRGFPPFEIGRFFLFGQHHAGIEIPAGKTPLMIDAVTAFGSGEHPTTKGCLLLLDDLAARGYKPAHILDHGTGSGILAIAAHKMWHVTVAAADNDPESVRVAAEYRDYNHVPADAMPTYLGETPMQADIIAHGPFDLIIANILALPLRALAPDMAAACAPQAHLILSGLLETQMNEVIDAYTPHGFKLADQKIITDWAAIHLIRG